MSSDKYEVRKEGDEEYAIYDDDGDFVCGGETYPGALRALASLAESGRWHKGMEVDDE